jgi:hypothetical protein
MVNMQIPCSDFGLQLLIVILCDFYNQDWGRRLCHSKLKMQPPALTICTFGDEKMLNVCSTNNFIYNYIHVY